MENKTLEADVNIDSVMIDGMEAGKILQPEQIARKAGLQETYSDNIYNHRHCDYRRCVLRTD